MKIILIIIGTLVALVIIFIIYRLIAVKIAQYKRAWTESERMTPLYTKFKNGEFPAEMIYEYASELLTREFTFDALKAYSKNELFPQEFNTIEKGAEVKLVRWLEFPTELGKCPDEIEYVKKVNVAFHGEDVYYHVFRFKTYEPHWAAKGGWSLGVVGLYFDISKPYDNATPFSRIGEATSPEEEVKWFHENITPRVLAQFRPIKIRN